MLHLDELTWPELDALDRGRTVIFIPFSPMEEHGPHLPIGTDLFVARHFAEALGREVEARRSGVTALVMPGVPLGAGTVPMRGSVNLTLDLVFDVARQIGVALARDGFKYIVFVNGHLSPWHLLALENAAAWVSRRYRIHAIAPSAAIARAVMRGGQIAQALENRLKVEDLRELLSAAHAGMLETSVMLHLHPHLVRGVFAELPALSRKAMLGWRGRTPARWQGYIGSPSLGDGEWGAAAIQALVNAGASLIVQMVDEDKGAARAAHLFPRVPFWLTARRALQLGAAALVGAGVTVLATQAFGQGRKNNGWLSKKW